MMLGGFRYAICAIASAGVRNASSISTATPSPVIVSLVGRCMIKPSSKFEGVSVIVLANADADEVSDYES